MFDVDFFCGLQEDVVYQYPTVSEQFVQIRGVFSTLVQLLVDVAKNKTVSSTLVLNKKAVHAQYYREANNLVVLLLPAEKLVNYCSIPDLFE